MVLVVNTEFTVGHSRHLRTAVMKLKQGAIALPSALFAVSRVPFISAWGQGVCGCKIVILRIRNTA